MRLERVPDRVPEVQEGARARLALVVADDRGSSPSIAARTIGQRAPPGRPVASARRARSSCSRSGRVRGERDLHDLGEPRRSLARAAASTRCARSATTALGWWKAPIRFLPDRVVEAGLAADRRVDHRRAASSGPARSGRRAGGTPPRSREIADDAAAGGDDQRVAIDAAAERGVPDRRDARERLVRLAGRQRDARDPRAERPQRGVERRAASALHVGVGDEDERRRRAARDRVRRGARARRRTRRSRSCARRAARRADRARRARRSASTAASGVEPRRSRATGGTRRRPLRAARGARARARRDRRPRRGSGAARARRRARRCVSGDAVSVTTSAWSSAKRRVRGVVTVPPPNAMTRGVGSREQRLDERALSRARNAASPSSRQRSGTRLPGAALELASVSTKGTPRRAARRGPTVLLPVAMKPLRTMGRIASVLDELGAVALDVARELAQRVAAELLEQRVGEDDARHRLARRRSPRRRRTRRCARTRPRRPPSCARRRWRAPSSAWRSASSRRGRRPARRS